MRSFRFAALALLAAMAGCADAPTAIPAPEAGPSLAVSRVDVWCPITMYVGDVSSCSAYGYDSNNQLVSTFASWYSGNPSSVSVSGGTLWANAPSGAWITATIQGVSRSTYVNVTYVKVVTSIAVSPSPTTVFLGGTRQLTATAIDQYGYAMSGVAFTWGSGNTSLATVSGSGLVSGVGLGSVSISASAGGKTGYASVSVTNPPLAVGISGSQYVTRHQSAQYTANTSGGTPGYTYQWRTRQGSPSFWGSWSGWFSTGSTNSTYASINSCGLDRNQIEVLVTDALGATATSSYTVYISNPC
ncbi:MAG TPA: Ig-like domain-containing protein [Longimicrobium sp.]|nr:Ig-like domain-containing protein [Longimicrobium sp.]